MLAIPFFQSDTLFETDRCIGLEFVDALKAQFGDDLLFVVVFGSKARGDADEESDMDLLVVMKHVTLKIRRQVRNLATEIWLANGQFLSTRVWDESYWKQMSDLSTTLYHNICEDGVLLYKQANLVE